MKSIALSPDAEKFIISYPPAAAARVIPSLKHYFTGHSYNRTAGVYEVPAKMANAGRLLQFADNFGFAVHETARQRFAKMHVAANLDRTFPGRVIRQGLDKKGRPAIHVKTDEFIRAVYDRVSAMPCAEFVDKYKAWAVPPSESWRVLKLADDFQFTVDPATRGWLEVEAAKEKQLANAGIRRKAALLEAAKDIPRGNFGGKTPRDYQVAGVSFLLDAIGKYEQGSGALLCDTMGLGKTLEAMLVARCFQRAFHCDVLIVTTVSVKADWVKEAQACGVKVSVHTWGTIPASHSKPFILIADEAHYAQDITSQRSQGIVKLGLSENCLCALPATGTPFRGGRMENFYPLLKLVRHPIAKDKRVYDDYWAVNSKSLMKQVAPIFLQRTKEQVLKDLPPKVVTIRNVAPSPAAQKLYNEAYNEARAKYEIERDVRVEAQCEASGFDYKPGMKEGAEALVLLGILRKAASIGKVEGAIEIADEVLEQGRKIIIFTEFTNSANALAAHYRKRGIDTELLTGAVKPEERPRMVERFQRGSSRVWVSTIKAGGVGLTLTAADTVILLDQAWMIDDCRQAEDRAHRQDAIMSARIKSGNAGSVSVYWLRGFEIDTIIQKRLAEQAQALKDVESGAASNTRSVKSINQMAAEVAREMFKREKA